LKTWLWVETEWGNEMLLKEGLCFASCLNNSGPIPELLDQCLCHRQKYTLEVADNTTKHSFVYFVVDQEAKTTLSNQEWV
jgi:hypothetical protein